MTHRRGRDREGDQVEVVWSGITRADTLHDEAAQARTDLADAARGALWTRVFELLTEHPDLVNVSRLGGSSLFAPLHQAAHAGASIEIVQRLVDTGAWRT